MQREAAIEILPGLLWWADPEFSNVTGNVAKAHRLSLSSIEASDFLLGKYQVLHYPPQTYGSSFGPLSLAQVTRWCLELSEKLEAHGQVIVEHDCNIEEWANSAVLLGAFMILQKGWSTRSLVQALPREAKFCFPCSWTRATKGQRHVLRVEDCWSGLELAHGMGWVRIGSLGDSGKAGKFNDASLVELAISQYYCMMMEYDATWIAPGEIMVAADPMTCVMDPNPGTCPSMGLDEVGDAAMKANVQAEADELEGSRFSPGISPRMDSKMSAPSEEERPSSKDSNLRSRRSLKGKLTVDTQSTSEMLDMTLPAGVSPTPCPEPLPTHKSNQSALTLDSWKSMTSMDSVLTVAKEYRYSAVDSLFSSARPEPVDFTSFCRKHDVKMVVRANDGDEAGIREIGGSYDGVEFRRLSGIDQADFFVSDKVSGPEATSGLPGPQVLRSFLLRYDQKNVLECMEGDAKLMRTATSEGTEVADDKAGALLVHCKGGFGRSMMLALCLLISRYDLPGRALLGWARIARPGAITTPVQEKFLAQIKGRVDLYRTIGFQGQPGCCSVQ